MIFDARLLYVCIRISLSTFPANISSDTVADSMVDLSARAKQLQLQSVAEEILGRHTYIRIHTETFLLSWRVAKNFKFLLPRKETLATDLLVYYRGALEEQQCSIGRPLKI